MSFWNGHVYLQLLQLMALFDCMINDPKEVMKVEVQSVPYNLTGEYQSETFQL